MTIGAKVMGVFLRTGQIQILMIALSCVEEPCRIGRGRYNRGFRCRLGGAEALFCSYRGAFRVQGGPVECARGGRRRFMGFRKWPRIAVYTVKQSGPSGGMADAGDLKSPVRKDVWVRIPPRLLSLSVLKTGFSKKC